MKYYIYLTSFSFLFFFSGCFFSDNSDEISEISNVLERKDEGDCSIEKTRKIISGNSMEPMIHNRDFIWLYPDFYKECKKTPHKGDLVAYDYGGKDIPIIKKVVAISEDVVQIKNESLWVNGEAVKNSVGQIYRFSKPEQSLLVMSAKNQHIPKGSILILGDNPRNSQDSRKFGAVSIADLLGKFEIYKK